MAKALSKSRRAEIEKRAWALSQQGWSQVRIGAELGVHHTTVSRALRACRRRVIVSLDDEARLTISVLVEQLEHVRDEAFQAWERSKQPKRKATRRTLGPIGAGGDQTTTDMIERDGEAEYLLVVLKAIDRVISLLNLDEVTRPGTLHQDEPNATVRDCLLEAERADQTYRDEPE